VPAVVRVDQPTRAGINADVTWPPQDVADLHFGDRDFGLDRSHRGRCPRKADAHRAPRLLDETGAIEALGPDSTPAIFLPYLRGGEADDSRGLGRRRWLRARPNGRGAPGHAKARVRRCGAPREDESQGAPYGPHGERLAHAAVKVKFSAKGDFFRDLA
jgi:hypothetical protein